MFVLLFSVGRLLFKRARTESCSHAAAGIPNVSHGNVQNEKKESYGIRKINSVHTRCIVKTSGFTRGVCKNRGFYEI